MLNANEVMKQKILKVNLEYEDAGTTSCSIIYSDGIIRCDIAFNPNR